MRRRRISKEGWQEALRRTKRKEEEEAARRKPGERVVAEEYSQIARDIHEEMSKEE
jgi:hypothetical protein